MLVLFAIRFIAQLFRDSATKNSLEVTGEADPV